MSFGVAGLLMWMIAVTSSWVLDGHCYFWMGSELKAHSIFEIEKIFAG